MRIRREFIPSADNFTIIPNAWARDPNLSRRAVGLLVELLSHREGWEVTVESLWRGGTEGKSTVVATIKELEVAGYLERRQERNGNRYGAMEYVLMDPVTSGAGDRDSSPRLSVTGTQATEDEVTEPAVTVNAPTKKTNPKKTKEEDEGRKGAASPRSSAPERASDSRPPNLEPVGRCAAHADGDPGTPCRACGIARREREEWLAGAPARRAEADREATRRFLEEQRSKVGSPRSSQWSQRIKADLAERSSNVAPSGRGTV